MTTPVKPYAPACERNREPILDVLKGYFLDRKQVLEIGSGTGAARGVLCWRFALADLAGGRFGGEPAGDSDVAR